MAAAVAPALGASGLIFLDAEPPPGPGPKRPGSAALRALVGRLTETQGRLPPWPDWFEGAAVRDPLGLTALEADPDACAAFRAG